MTTLEIDSCTLLFLAEFNFAIHLFRCKFGQSFLVIRSNFAQIFISIDFSAMCKKLSRCWWKSWNISLLSTYDSNESWINFISMQNISSALIFIHILYEHHRNDEKVLPFFSLMRNSICKLNLSISPKCNSDSKFREKFLLTLMRMCWNDEIRLMSLYFSMHKLSSFQFQHEIFFFLSSSWEVKIR